MFAEHFLRTEKGRHHVFPGSLICNLRLPGRQWSTLSDDLIGWWMMKMMKALLVEEYGADFTFHQQLPRIYKDVKTPRF